MAPLSARRSLHFDRNPFGNQLAFWYLKSNTTYSESLIHGHILLSAESPCALTLVVLVGSPLCWLALFLH